MKFETAESVTLGHPDKLCDFIADSILDEALSQDKNARVAMEVMLAHNSLFLGGEISADAELDCTKIAHDAIKRAGYKPPINTYKDIDEQSYDIAQAVDKDEEPQGAGDQGVMYGYATSSTLSRLPLAVDLAHRLTDRMMLINRVGNKLGIKLGPDGKAQVTVAYDDDGSFDSISSVLVSTQHDNNVDIGVLRELVKNDIIKPALVGLNLDKTELIINPSGRFVKGGFEADTGLTGRKLMVDTYGGIARHGGGALSGKDPSKVDRSGAYMARYIANVIIEAELAHKCEVSIAYAIGRAEPTAINVETFGTSQLRQDEYLTKAVMKAFDTTPAGIISKLKLTSARYAETAAHGHFGAHKDLPWEKVSKDDVIRLKNMLDGIMTDGDFDKTTRR